MAKLNTNWEEFGNFITELCTLMKETPLTLSQIREKIYDTKFPVITQMKTRNYFKKAISLKMLTEVSLNRFTIEKDNEQFFKPVRIKNYCKTGEIKELTKEPEKTVVTEIVQTDCEFNLKQKVYFINDNKFQEGTIVGIMFIDTDNCDGLSFLVRYNNGTEFVVKQMLISDIFKSIADLANSLIKEFKVRYPDYGTIKR